MEPIRILYVNGGPLNRGGIESYMMNYYRNFDRDKIQIDFVSIGLERAAYDDEINSLGGKIYYIPKKSKNYIGYIKALREIFKSEKYRIVHTHMDAMGMTVLKEAKKCNIPIRIAHSHNTQHLTNNTIKLRVNEYARKNINKYATHMFACSEAAGRWLFGDEAFEEGKVCIVKNAINIEKFDFNIEQRSFLRNKYGILNDEIVIGHVGRFDYQKNHDFLINVFKKVTIKDNKYKLMLIGDGHLKNKIEEKINILGIKENVILTGAVNNAFEYFNAFDMFILPSVFEGLPVVGIEAQANGLACFVSNNITKEICINPNVDFLPIDNTNIWVKNLMKEKSQKRIDNNELILKSGYDIKQEATILQKKYISLWKGSL